MGFYTEEDLPFYYFMASQFATSDRWFSPVMSRTQPNRIFGLGASDFGYIYPPGPTGDPSSIPIQRQKHFPSSGRSAHLLENLRLRQHRRRPESVLNHTYLGYFQPFESQHKEKIVHRAQFFTDLQNGTLPQVALIEPDGADEHPQTDLQVGAQEVAKILNTFMDSSAWKDSVFILTYDEGGDFYDHVAPQPAVLPDNIPPRYLKPFDVHGHVRPYGVPRAAHRGLAVL